MAEKQEILHTLRQVRSGALTPEEALLRLKALHRKPTEQHPPSERSALCGRSRPNRSWLQALPL